VLLTEEGPRVIDFGIAGGVRTGAGAHSAGSPGFMSPEQLTGEVTGPASDVFSYGATLAYALTGTSRLDSVDVDLDAGLRALLARCLEADPDRRPSVAELVSATRDAVSGGVSLPAAVLAEIHQRAGEAANPPVEPPAAPPPGRQVSRRALLIAAGTAALASGGAVTALVLSGDEPVRGTAKPATTTGPATTTTVPLTPITESDDRRLEIVVGGQTTLYTLTTTVNGQVETVTNVALPWRRIVAIPAWPTRSTWRIDYHRAPGSLDWQVIVDGQRYANGGNSSTSQDVQDFKEGTV
jgi:hypothetical protein